MSYKIIKYLCLLLLLNLLVTSLSPCFAQFGQITDKIRDKVEQKIKDKAQQEIAKRLDDRKWTDEQKQAAAKAQSLFSKATGSSNTLNIPDPGDSIGIYNPKDPIQTARQLSVIEKVKQKYQGRRELQEEEAIEFITAYLPFLRYAEVTDMLREADLEANPSRPAQVAAGKVTIPAHATVRFSCTTYCLDASDPAPKPGEKMYLKPIDKLLHKDAVPVYKALASYGSVNPNAHHQVQRIVWNIRHSMSGRRALELQAEDRSLIEKLYPGGTGILGRDSVKQQLKRMAIDEGMKRLEPHLRRLPFDLKQAVPNVAVADEIIAHMLEAQESLDVDGKIPDDNSNYSLLQEGVAVRSLHSGGARKAQIEVRNTTSQSVTFNPADWALESQRVTQRLGFGDAEPTGGEQDPSVFSVVKGVVKDFISSLTPVDVILLVTPIGLEGMALKGTVGLITRYGPKFVNVLKTRIPWMKFGTTALEKPILLTFRPYIPIGDAKKGLIHILGNHGPNSIVTNSGKFVTGTTATDLRNMAIKAGEGGGKWTPQGTWGKIEYDFGKTMGVDDVGRPTSWVRVVLDANGRVHTMYPITP